MLGQPVSMLIPRVVGFKLSGALPRGRHRDRPGADDHRDAAQARRGRQVRGVLRQRRRRRSRSPTGPRSATCRRSTDRRSRSSRSTRPRITYLRLTGRDDQQLALVEAYAKEQGLWHDPDAEPRYSERLELDLSDRGPVDRGAEASAGPDRPRRRQGGVPPGARATTSGDGARHDEAGRLRRGLGGVLPGQRPTVVHGLERVCRPTGPGSGRRRGEAGPTTRSRVTLEDGSAASRSTTAPWPSRRSPRAPTPRTRRS